MTSVTEQNDFDAVVSAVIAAQRVAIHALEESKATSLSAMVTA